MGTVYLLELGKAHARIAENKVTWFAAVKHHPAGSKSAFEDDWQTINWRSRADTVLVGEGLPYWDEFYVLGGEDPAASPILPASVVDAYIVRIEPVRLPLLLSGTLSMLHRLGISRVQTDTTSEGFRGDGFEAELGPSQENVAALTSRPDEQQPAMVNFLRYSDSARYETGGHGRLSGEEAYALYGSIAFRTVYRLGGQLVTSGTIVEVVREAEAGPTVGAWDSVAIMQYPNQRAILLLESVQEYREALTHRNAGLSKTRVVASLPF